MEEGKPLTIVNWQKRNFWLSVAALVATIVIAVVTYFGPSAQDVGGTDDGTVSSIIDGNGNTVINKVDFKCADVAIGRSAQQRAANAQETGTGKAIGQSVRGNNNRLENDMDIQYGCVEN